MPHEQRVLQAELELKKEELCLVQQELDELRFHYNELYDSAQNNYVTLNKNGIILKANPSFANLLEVSKEELSNQPLSKYVCEEDVSVYQQHLSRVLKHKKDSYVSYTYICQHD